MSSPTAIDPSWMGPQEDQGGKRVLRWSLGFAAAVHAVFFFVHFPCAAREPVRIEAVMPAYTEIARKGQIQGYVVLQTVIDNNGDVDDVRVLKGLPLGLTEAAVGAVTQWKYRPVTLNGKPVAVYFNLTVNFHLLG
ncbi:MAG: energy transducer TonB [Acidobacteriota bacterium]|nr:energy transducer TonB [Acidobacteriota bacterium]